MDDQPPSGVSLTLIWDGVDDLPVMAANAFVLQLAPNADGRPESLIFSVGHAAPPLVLGSPQEQAEVLLSMSSLQVSPLARFSVSRSRLDELVKLFQTSAQNFDAAMGAGHE